MRRLSRRSLVMLALGLLLVLDVVLIGLALRHGYDDDATASSPSERAASGGGPTSSSSPTPSESATEAPTRGVDRGAALLLDADGSTALRAVPGTCADGGAAAELSTDGGASWQPLDVPARSLLRVNVIGSADLWAVGTDAECSPTFLRSGDTGATWDTGASTAGAWHLLPARPDGTPADRLHAPQSTVDAPCTGGAAPVDLSGIDEADAVMLCDDGRSYATDDAGSTWQDGDRVKRARALAFEPAGSGYAVALGTARCDGAAISGSADAGATWDRRSCVAGVRGPVAVAVTGDGEGLLTDGETTWATTDDGETWQPLS